MRKLSNKFSKTAKGLKKVLKPDWSRAASRAPSPSPSTGPGTGGDENTALQFVPQDESTGPSPAVSAGPGTGQDENSAPHAEPQNESTGPSPAVSTGPGTGGDENATPQAVPQNETTVLPWVEWAPDKNFLQELKKWEDDHPRNKLAGILDKVNSALESGTVKALLDFIPNASIPVKALVETLISVVQLGIKFGKVRRDAHDFVKAVIDDLTDLLGAFDDELGGDLLDKAWDDLMHRRDIVNAICTWADKQLTTSTPDISTNTVEEWKEKLAKAERRFTEKILLRIAAADDARAVLEDIRTKLGARIASSVQYTDQNKQFCHDGTRIDILDELQSWTRRPSDPKRCYWITGRPGSGKSTLAATFARELKNQGMLCAQYFITRNSASTVDSAKLFPTLSQQLAKQSRSAARVIRDGLNTGVADRLGHGQAVVLLLRPMEQITKRSVEPVVALIDALDELDRPPADLSSILSKLSSQLPDNAKIVITSRPENEILNSVKIADTVHLLDLDTTKSVNEVGQFIQFRMKEIILAERSSDTLEWVAWRGQVVQKLSEKADGLFQYANTSTSWIHDQIRKDGMACQQTVLEKIGNLGMTDLDGLYNLVLSQWAGDNKKRSENFCRVVGCLVYLRKPLCIIAITALLNIDKKDFDMINFFQRMRSVLIAGNDSVDGRTIPQMHKSFREYITSKDRSPHGFCIEERKAHIEIARACFQAVNTANEQNVAFGYAADRCFYHRWQAIGPESAPGDTFAEDMKLMLTDTVFKIWHVKREWDADIIVNICKIGWHWKQDKGLGAGAGELSQLQSLLVKMKKTGEREEQREEFEEELRRGEERRRFEEEEFEEGERQQREEERREFERRRRRGLQREQRREELEEDRQEEEEREELQFFRGPVPYRMIWGDGFDAAYKSVQKDVTVKPQEAERADMI